MTFISYAQNLEDVLLWRALGNIDGGFYIDVGANDPEQDSVTKAFYERGWRGVNIEPLPGHHQALVAARTRDINLAVALGAKDEGELTLYDVPSVRGWASLSRDVAAKHAEEGHEVVESRVPVRTLTSICNEYVTGEIHFLKIDVEGFESEVIKGMDFERWRPWIVIIEATQPNSSVPSYEEWEPLIVDYGYSFAYFDGLNRYYISAEHNELASDFSVQPNVFDDYATIGQIRASQWVQEYREKAEEYRIKAERYETDLSALYNSASWKLTKPIRFIGKLIKYFLFPSRLDK